MKKNILLYFFVLFIWTGYAQTGNVGIGNTTPATKLDVAGDLALREGTAIAVTGLNTPVTVALTTANSENSFYRIINGATTPTGIMTMNRITNGVDGQIITLVNNTSIKLKLTNNSPLSGGILTPGALDLIILPNGSVTLQFSVTPDRWFITNSTGSTFADWTKANTTDEPATKTDDQYVTGKVGIGNFSTSTLSNAPLEVKYTGAGAPVNWDPQTMGIYVNDTRSAAANVGGGIGFAGNYTGTTYAGLASIWGGKENGTAGNFASYLGFATRINGGSVLERMRIKSDGEIRVYNLAFTETTTNRNSAPVFVNNEGDLKQGGNNIYAMSLSTLISPDDLPSSTGYTQSKTNDVISEVNMPFSVEIEGKTYDRLEINSNGWVTFERSDGTDEASNPGSVWDNTAMPVAAFSNPTIFPYWNDLTLEDGSDPGAYLQYGYWGTTPGRTYFVNWEATIDGQESGSNDISFQVQIHETTGCISVIYYADGEGFTNSSTATVGFQGDGGSDAKIYPVDYNGRFADDNRTNAASEGWSICPVR